MVRTESKTQMAAQRAPKIENRGSYLFVEIIRPYSLQLILSTIQQISDACKHETLGKVLVDLRDIKENISIMDRYEIGVETARIIGPGIQVAAIARRNIINYMAENVAVNRGANLKVFSDKEAALKWLDVE